MAVLAAAGVTVGIVVAVMGVYILPRMLPREFPRVDEIALRANGLVWPILGVCGALCAGAGWARVWLRAVEQRPGSMSQGWPRASSSRTRAWALGVQAAITVVIVAAAMTAAQHYHTLASRDLGFAPAQAITASVSVPGASSSPQRSKQFIEAALATLQALPGVRHVGAANQMPFSESSYFTTFEMPAQVLGGEPVVARQTEYQITPGYAEAVGLRLRRGRFPTDSDISGAVRVALVNEQFARQYLGPIDRVGTIFPNGLGSSDRPTQIIGIVADLRKDGPTTEVQPELYLVPTDGLSVRRELNFVVRAHPALSPDTVRRALRDIDATVFIDRVATLSSLVDDTLTEPRASAALLVVMGGVALCLVAVGMFSAVSSHLLERRHDYGVRAALGAPTMSLITLALRQGLTPVATGCVIAAVLAVGAGHVASLQLPQVALDARMLGAIIMASLAAALIAASPALWLILRSDPLDSMRRT
jgi:hypothetical protein